MMLCLCAAVIARADDADVVLDVKPRLCVMGGDRKCDASVVAAWRSRQPGAFCLHASGRETPLQCWQEMREGRYLGEHQIDGTLTLILIAATGAEVARSEIEVLASDTSDRRRKRRRRHVWSIL
ncbi:MAG: DUF3019 domain-containing protein [Gammaproteobacteria bacterium]|nr:DUF3019 domain-containing protein [Gammaproteobacteria bacterium]